MRAGRVFFRIGELLLIGGMALTLAACENRAATWLRLTQNGGVTFFAPVSCGSEPNGNLTVIGAYSLARSFQFGGGIGGADPNPFYDHPRMKERFPGDYYAYTLTIIDQSGRDSQTKAFLLGARDAIGVNFTIPYVGRSPGPLTTVTLVPFGDGTRTYPVNTSIGMCGYLARMPWSRDLNLPYWIPRELLDPNALANYQAALFLASTGLYVLYGLLGFGFVCLCFGFFDVDGDAARKEARKNSLIMYAVSVTALLLVLMLLRSGLEPPIEQLAKGQAYYQFYEQLPKSSGLLQPINYSDAQRLFAGPPTPDAMQQSPQPFWWIFFFGLVGGGVAFGLRVYKGWYWLFVPLPLRVSFKRAAARGEWPEAEEIIEAIRAGTMDKNTWQSKAMATKADQFATELARQRERLERKMLAQ